MILLRSWAQCSKHRNIFINAYQITSQHCLPPLRILANTLSSLTTQTTSHIDVWNRVPKTGTNQIPHELWTRRPFQHTQLRPFGSTVYVRDHVNTNKLAARYIKCRLLGYRPYAETINRYYAPATLTFNYSRDYLFERLTTDGVPHAPGETVGTGQADQTSIRPLLIGYADAAGPLSASCDFTTKLVFKLLAAGRPSFLPRNRNSNRLIDRCSQKANRRRKLAGIETKGFHGSP